MTEDTRLIAGEEEPEDQETDGSLRPQRLGDFVGQEHAVRQFCKVCGAGLFYRNAVNLPGLIDVQTATLDDPEALAPTVQVQAAEKLVWVDRLGEMPAFPRFPNQDD